MFCSRKIELHKDIPDPPTTLVTREMLAEYAQAGRLLEHAQAQAKLLLQQAQADCESLLQRANDEFWQRANAQLHRWELERQAMYDSLEQTATYVTQQAIRTVLAEALPTQRLTALLKKLLDSQVPVVVANLLCNPHDREQIEQWLIQHNQVPWTLRCEEELPLQTLILETDEGGFHIDWNSAIETLMVTHPR